MWKKMSETIWSKKNRLDEMQELKLLKAEGRGFWIGFFGLFTAILAQIFYYGPEFAKTALAGEFIVFLGMGVYLMIACLRSGIWDRHLQPTLAVNIGLSLFAAAVTALFNAVICYHNYQKFYGALAVFVVSFLLVGAGLVVTLCICTVLYQKRRKQLEKEDPDEEEETHTAEDNIMQ